MIYKKHTRNQKRMYRIHKMEEQIEKDKYIIGKQEQELERYKNIIDELEKWLDYQAEHTMQQHNYYGVLDKLEELKGE